MTEERRYDEEEVAEIFEAATAEGSSGTRAVTPGEGLSLSEIQSIGREVGVAPERIAEAATALDVRRRGPVRRKWLGMPLSVGRIVELPRAPTDREWGLLVADVRQAFGARGRLASQEGLREWSNGNLHVCVEPSEEGYRLRMGTLKESALQFGRMGLGLLGIAVVLAVVMTVSGWAADAFFAPLFLGALGAAGLASSALTLPSWARRREAQMERLGARALELVGSGGEEGEQEGEGRSGRRQ